MVRKAHIKQSRISLIVIALLLATLQNVLSQGVPSTINFQGIARKNINGEPLLKDTDISLRLSITKSTREALYSETHSVRTSKSGFYSIQIGNGQLIMGSFSEINWLNNSLYLLIEIDGEGGSSFEEIGFSQMISVPYSLASEKSSYSDSAKYLMNKLTKVDTALVALSVIDSDNAIVISAADTASWNSKLDSYSETDPIFSNSVSYHISASDTSYWNSKLDFEQDSSNTNEIQILTKTGLDIVLSSGGSVKDSVNVYSAGRGIEIINNTISQNGHYVGELFEGGIVFWVAPDGEHGLVASLEDLGNDAYRWGNEGTYIGAIDAIDGFDNTQKIIEHDLNYSQPAKLCYEYSKEGFGNWYLPSRLELTKLVHAFLDLDYILNQDDDPSTNGLDFSPIDYNQFSNGISTVGGYWSSTEQYGGDNVVAYENIGMSTYPKSIYLKVRAIRRF